MEFEISVAHSEDTQHIAALWHAGWHEAHARIVPPPLVQLRTFKSFAQRSEEHCAITHVARQGDALLGFCMTKDNELYQMFTAPFARSSGVAAALMADAEARFSAAGHSRGWLSCAIGNDRAARFYQKCGWALTDTKIEPLDTSAGKFDLKVWRFEKTLGQSRTA